MKYGYDIIYCMVLNNINTAVVRAMFSFCYYAILCYCCSLLSLT